jgi:hypothetical protein
LSSLAYSLYQSIPDSHEARKAGGHPVTGPPRARRSRRHRGRGRASPSSPRPRR